jgi:hypothetical protein
MAIQNADREYTHVIPVNLDGAMFYLQPNTSPGMSSVAWCNTISDVHEYRTNRDPWRLKRVKDRIRLVDNKHHTIYSIPSILYNNFVTPATVKARTDIYWHLEAHSNYITVYPESDIRELVLMTIIGLNQGGMGTPHRTLYTVYQHLHFLVEREIKERREQCRLKFKKIRDENMAKSPPILP